MKTAKEWLNEIGERPEYQDKHATEADIRAIQVDALRHAAVIIQEHESLYAMGMLPPEFISVAEAANTAIENEAKQLDENKNP